MKVTQSCWTLGLFSIPWTIQSGEGKGKPLQYSCLENPMNSMKRQKDKTLKDELPGSVGAQYATGDQWRNNSRNNEGRLLLLLLSRFSRARLCANPWMAAHQALPSLVGCNSWEQSWPQLSDYHFHFVSEVVRPCG